MKHPVRYILTLTAIINSRINWSDDMIIMPYWLIYIHIDFLFDSSSFIVRFLEGSIQVCCAEFRISEAFGDNRANEVRKSRNTK